MNSEEYFASLLPNALYDGSVAVHEPSYIERVGGGILWYINVVCSMVVMFAAILHINDIRRMGERKGIFMMLLFALSLTPYVFLNNDNQTKIFYINQCNYRG